MRLTIFLLSALAMASVVLAQERVEDPPRVTPVRERTSLERVSQGLAEANEKLDTNHQAILDVAGELHDFAAGGATHWISPRWYTYRYIVMGEIGAIAQEDCLTQVYIVNTSLAFPADLSINVYDVDGVLDAERSSHLKIPPRGVKAEFLHGDKNSWDSGWLEVVSDRKVFVEGEILIQRHVDQGIDLQAVRTMTWYRADSE